jgi:hypothetical protein
MKIEKILGVSAAMLTFFLMRACKALICENVTLDGWILCRRPAGQARPWLWSYSRDRPGWLLIGGGGAVRLGDGDGDGARAGAGRAGAGAGSGAGPGRGGGFPP